ncbi:MAG TPA: peptide deformylase [Bacteroidia bacterium]|jgi:peptide deformylase|nr:peptide deformylase [Bacteroidia bacterium]
MILPIVAFGDPVLKKKAVDITKDYPGLSTLIANMFETMQNAKGVGLAAPQIGLSIRLFIIDASPYVINEDDDEEEEEEEDTENLKNFRKIFINAQILEQDGTEWKFNEGCLSIPTIREDVERKPNLKIRYVDENFVQHEEEYSGVRARIIQHEYDHIDGILFTDRINPLRKRLLKRKLNDISKGAIDVKYKMKFPIKK